MVKQKSKSRPSSRNISMKGSRKPSIAKSRKSHMTPQKKIQKKTNKQKKQTVKKQTVLKDELYFKVEQDWQILNALEKLKKEVQKSQEKKSLSDEQKQAQEKEFKKNRIKELTQLAKNWNVKYGQVSARAKIINKLDEKIIEQLRKIKKKDKQLYVLYHKNLENAIELKKINQIEVVDNLIKKEYQNIEKINGINTENKFTLEQDVDIYKFFKQIEGQSSNNLTERKKKMAKGMKKKTIFLVQRFKLLNKLSKSDLDTIEIEKDNNPKYYAHLDYKDGELTLVGITKYPLHGSKLKS